MQKEKQLVPNLRFPEFDGTWKNITLGEICKIQTGSRDTQDKEENGLYPFYVRSNTIERINSYSFDEEAILTSGDGAGVGKIFHLVDGKFDLHQRVYALTNFDSNFSIRYTYHFFSEKFYKRVMRLSAKNSVDSVRRDMIFDMKMPYPKKEEQKKIANFLTAVDTQIQTLEKKKSLLEQYKKGVMQKIFKQELRFKDENGEAFSEWEERKLGTYLNHKSIRNKKLEVMRTLSVSNSKGFILQSEQFDNHRVASKNVSNYKIVFKNDIAYNPSRINVGSIATLKDFEIGIVSPMYVVFSLKDTLDLTFFENLITTHLFKHLVKVGCSGSVRDSLNFDDLENFKLKLPSLKEQIKIANFLSAIDKNIDLVNKKIEYTKAYKKGLLQQMFV